MFSLIFFMLLCSNIDTIVFLCRSCVLNCSAVCVGGGRGITSKEGADDDDDDDDNERRGLEQRLTAYILILILISE